MRGALGAAMLAVALAGGAARAAEPPCLLVFGHGRNHEAELPEQNRQWDLLNAAFNAAVRAPLEQAGRRTVALVLPVAATDLARNLELLLAEAVAHGCSQVLETTLFADFAAQTLVARLRLYPLLGSLGPRAAQVLPTVGQPIFTNQREFDLQPRVLERLRPQALGEEMARQTQQQLPAP